MAVGSVRRCGIRAAPLLSVLLHELHRADGRSDDEGLEPETGRNTSLLLAAFCLRQKYAMASRRPGVG